MFEGALKLYFLHLSTIIGSICVSVWIQEGWIEWLPTPLENSPPKNIIFGETNENRWTQFQPFEANQPLSFINRHALGH